MVDQLRRAFARLFICPVRGHHYDTPDFNVYSLYFCVRCRKELLDRTIDDLRTLPRVSDEQLNPLHRRQP